jgi:hypothetical protein
MERAVRRTSMKRQGRTRVFRNVVEWMDSLPPGKRRLLKRAASNAEKLRKASHG